MATAILLPLPEAREALGGVSESTVRRLVASGSLESVKVGRRRMVTVRSLDALVDRLSAEGASDA
jgi:excisionase family DNA binding protein